MYILVVDKNNDYVYHTEFKNDEQFERLKAFIDKFYVRKGFIMTCHIVDSVTLNKRVIF